MEVLWVLRKGSIGVLIGFMTLGRLLFQFSLGELSDLVDRRFLIAGVPLGPIPVCMMLAGLENPTDNLH